jgi:signal transduction histidine kinase
MFLDVPRIENTFVNIIKNAIDAISEKGDIIINASIKGPNLETSFTDSGLGIPQSIMPKIFSPLVTTKAKGMGMSLAICKRIVEAHGGKITVETAIGKGTTFTVILPIKQSKNEFAPSVDFCVDLNQTFSLASTK